MGNILQGPYYFDSHGVFIPPVPPYNLDSELTAPVFEGNSTYTRSNNGPFFINGWYYYVGAGLPPDGSDVKCITVYKSQTGMNDWVRVTRYLVYSTPKVLVGVMPYQVSATVLYIGLDIALNDGSGNRRFEVYSFDTVSEVLNKITGPSKDINQNYRIWDYHYINSQHWMFWQQRTNSSADPDIFWLSRYSGAWLSDIQVSISPDNPNPKYNLNVTADSTYGGVHIVYNCTSDTNYLETAIYRRIYDNGTMDAGVKFVDAQDNHTEYDFTKSNYDVIPFNNTVLISENSFRYWDAGVTFGRFGPSLFVGSGNSPTSFTRNDIASLINTKWPRLTLISTSEVQMWWLEKDDFDRDGSGNYKLCKIYRSSWNGSTLSTPELLFDDYLYPAAYESSINRRCGWISRFNLVNNYLMGLGSFVPATPQIGPSGGDWNLFIPFSSAELTVNTGDSFNFSDSFNETVPPDTGYKQGCPPKVERVSSIFCMDWKTDVDRREVITSPFCLGWKLITSERCE